MNRSRLAACAVVLLLSGVANAADNKPQPIRIAAPGFNAVGVDDKVADFFSDHFAQQLALQGVSVISASEIGALVGLERQKQLMGCSESSSSCVAELANAMGADGVITGSVGKFGTRLQANIKILGANSGQALSILSRKASSEDELLDMLTDAAAIAAGDLRAKLRPGEPTPDRPSTANSASNASATTPGSSNASSVSQPSAHPPSATQTAAAQGPLNAVSISPVGLVMGWFGAEFEHGVGGGLTLLVAPQFIKPWWSDMTAFEVTGGARYYSSGKPFDGFFFGAQLTVGAGTAVDTTNGLTYEGVAIAPGVMVGFSANLGGRVPLSVGAGVAYDILRGDYTYYYILNQAFPLLRLNLGFAF